MNLVHIAPAKLVLAAGLFAGGSSMLLFFALMIGMLVMTFVPQQRKQKQWSQMLANIKTGDKITTSGGIKGTVVLVKDDSLVLRTAPDGLKLEFAKNAVSAVTTEEEAKA